MNTLIIVLMTLVGCLIVVNIIFNAVEDNKPAAFGWFTALIWFIVAILK